MTTHGFTLTAEGPFDFRRLAALRRGLAGHQRAALRRAVAALRLLRESDWLPIGVTVTAAPGGVAVATTRAAGPGDQGRWWRAFLSLDVDGTGFAELGEADPVLGDLQQRPSSLRPVCFWSPWEAACWAVIVQRSSMLIASRIKQRIAERFGAKVTVDGQVYAAFPPPVTLLEAGGLGLPAQKEEWVHGLARARSTACSPPSHLARARAGGGTGRTARPAGRGPVLRGP
ncbi:hypothetical protein [Nonomuraea dietziae]|uniref:hypothetical protein n=1 Tax=Nonomuraea dietziae TaxID=65515 RepID=UPI0031CE3548